MKEMRLSTFRPGVPPPKKNKKKKTGGSAPRFIKKQEKKIRRTRKSNSITFMNGGLPHVKVF